MEESSPKPAPTEVVITKGKVVADFEEINLVIDSGSGSDSDFIPLTQLPKDTSEK